MVLRRKATRAPSRPPTNPDLHRVRVVLARLELGHVGVEARGERPLRFFAGEWSLVEPTELATTYPFAADERPCLPLVGPVVGLQAVRFVEMRDRCVALTGSPQVVGQLEVCGSFGTFHRSWLRGGNHLIGRHR